MQSITHDQLAQASNPNTKEEVLRQLAEIDNPTIYNALLDNPKLPGDVVSKLFDLLKGPYIFNSRQYDVLMHPNCPWHDIGEMAWRFIESMHLIDFGQTYKVSKLLDRLIEIAKDKSCPPEALIYFGKIDVTFDHDSWRYHEEECSNVDKKAHALRRIAKFQLAKYKMRSKRHKKEELSEEEKLNQKKRELENSKSVDEKKKQELEAARTKILEYLAGIKELSEKINKDNIDNKFGISATPRIDIPIEELVMSVDDHFEFNPLYKPYLDYINLVFVDSNNLKVSGIDFSKTNIAIDPQTVFNKDLSNSRFNDINITFKTFNGCNLSGTDISEELESEGFENIITDENTKLPNIGIKMGK